jgi:mRNA interferase YafQ
MKTEYSIFFSTSFKKDLKKQISNEIFVKDTIKILAEKGVKGIPENRLPHLLKGKYKNYWECHIKPDLLLIWKQNDEEKSIILARVGSHSNLFE